MRVKNVGIVGGGPGGLITAYYLEQIANWPLHITLFEATGRLGGKIITPCFQTIPIPYEAGAAEFYDYSHFEEDPLKELIAELGLSISPMGGSAVIMNDCVLSNDTDIYEQLGAAVGRELRTFDRRAKDSMTPEEFYDSDDPEGLSKSLRGSHFDDYLDEIREPSARRYVETLIHSDLATEPRITNTPYGLQNYLMNDAAYMSLYGILGGNERLPQELAARIQAEKLMEHQVVSIGKDQQRLRVRSEFHGQPREDHFDFVVVALPHNQVPSVTFEGNRLSAAMQAHQSHYDHPAHYLRVTLLFERPFWRPRLTDSFWMLDKFDGCCLYDESSRQPGCTHGILGWLLGGDMAEEMCDWGDEQLIEAALDSLPTFLAEGRQCLIEGRVQRWPSAVNSNPGGLERWKLDRRHQPEPLEHPQLFVVGDYLYDSTLNGIEQSADYVAEWIAALLVEGH